MAMVLETYITSPTSILLDESDRFNKSKRRILDYLSDMKVAEKNIRKCNEGRVQKRRKKQNVDLTCYETM